MNIFTLTYLFLSGIIVSTLSANIIVDDSDPRWTFSGSWNVITPSTPCVGCIQADPSRAFNHTWHDTSRVASASLLFNGVSIQIYTICPGVGGHSTNFTFKLDNNGDGSFVGPIPSCSQFVYNYLVYARTNLTDGPHQFKITNNNFTVSPPHSEISALLLDYAIYDNGTSVPPPAVTVTVTGSTQVTRARSSVPIGGAVGPIVVAALSLIANLVQWSWHRRSKRLRNHVGGDAIDSDVISPSGNQPPPSHPSVQPIPPSSDAGVISTPGNQPPPSGQPIPSYSSGPKSDDPQIPPDEKPTGSNP